MAKFIMLITRPWSFILQTVESLVIRECEFGRTCNHKSMFFSLTCIIRIMMQLQLERAEEHNTDHTVDMRHQTTSAGD